MSKTVKTRVSNLAFTSTEWANKNPILKLGEIGYDTTQNKFKIGDGASNWNSLEFQVESSIDTGLTCNDFDVR